MIGFSASGRGQAKRTYKLGNLLFGAFLIWGLGFVVVLLAGLLAYIFTGSW